MISRVADHCFWFGRYLERTESTARMLVVTLNLALDAELTPRQCWLPAVIVSGEEAQFTGKFGASAADDGEVVQRYLTWDEENFACIRRSVNAARDNARSIREVVSLEVWETINELYIWLGSHEAQDRYRDHRYGFYRHVRQAIQLCIGLMRTTMLHDTPLEFIWLGALLERAGQTARTLDVHHHALTNLPAEKGLRPPHPSVGPKHHIVETALWLSLLRACSGFEPFMKRHQGQVDGHKVASFLILEPQFPRSVRYCVRLGYDLLSAIRPPEATALPGGATLERLRALDAWLVEHTPESLAPERIHDVLTHVVDETAEICNAIGQELLGEPASATPPQESQ